MHTEEQDPLVFFLTTVIIIIILTITYCGNPKRCQKKQCPAIVKSMLQFVAMYPAFDMEWCSISAQFNYMLLLYIVDGSH